MFKIDSYGSSPGNEFVDKDTLFGTPGTRLTADWLNSLQREIIAVLTAASMSPSKANDHQLVDAVNYLISLSAGGGGGGGSSYWIDAVANPGSLPAGKPTGSIGLSVSDLTLYRYSGSAWVIYLKPADYAPVSTAVTLSGTQTLTNKTLTAPVINAPTGIVKADVGLSLVENAAASGLYQPVSAALSALAAVGSVGLLRRTGSNTYDTEAFVSIAEGGTGQITASLAFAALSPMTTKGDLTGYSTTPARVPVGSPGKFLMADPAQGLGLRWADAPNPTLNYWDNGTFELSSAGAAIGGWTFYTGASATPSTSAVTTDGAPTITFLGTASAIRGNLSGILTKPASNCQGKGIYRDFTINNIDRSRAFILQFDYLTTLVASGDFKVYLWDQSNNVLLAVSTTDLDLGYGTLAAKCLTTLGVTYRLMIHCASAANVAAATVTIDSGSFGPEASGSGGLVSKEIAADLNPAVNNVSYNYGTLVAARTLTLPTGTSAFSIQVLGSADSTNTLSVAGVNGNTEVYRYANFNATYYRAAGSSVIGVARQAATLIAGGTLPGLYGGFIGDIVTGTTSVATNNSTSATTLTPTLSLPAGVWEIVYFDTSYRSALPASAQNSTATSRIQNTTDNTTVAVMNAYQYISNVSGDFEAMYVGSFYMSAVVTITSAKNFIGQGYLSAVQGSVTTRGAGKFYAKRIG